LIPVLLSLFGGKKHPTKVFHLITYFSVLNQTLKASKAKLEKYAVAGFFATFLLDSNGSNEKDVARQGNAL